MSNDVINPAAIISTRSHEFDLENPVPSTIDFTDITTSLGRMVRYTGHTDTPVTVLQHLAICDYYAGAVLRVTSPLQRLGVLLHDVHEAYIGDISRPLKHYIEAKSGGAIAELEARIDTAVWTALEVPPLKQAEVDKDLVRQVDQMALSAEVRVAWPMIVAEGRWSGLVPVDRGFLSVVRHILTMSPDEIAGSYLRVVGTMVTLLRAGELVDLSHLSGLGHAKSPRVN